MVEDWQTQIRQDIETLRDGRRGDAFHVGAEFLEGNGIDLGSVLKFVSVHRGAMNVDIYPCQDTGDTVIERVS